MPKRLVFEEICLGGGRNIYLVVGAEGYTSSVAITSQYVLLQKHLNPNYRSDTFFLPLKITGSLWRSRKGGVLHAKLQVPLEGFLELRIAGNVTVQLLPSDRTLNSAQSCEHCLLIGSGPNHIVPCYSFVGRLPVSSAIRKKRRYYTTLQRQKCQYVVDMAGEYWQLHNLTIGSDMLWRFFKVLYVGSFEFIRMDYDQHDRNSRPRSVISRKAMRRPTSIAMLPLLLSPLDVPKEI